MVQTNERELAAIRDYLRQTAPRDDETPERLRSGLAKAASGLPQLKGIRTEKAAIGSLTGEWSRVDGAEPEGPEGKGDREDRENRVDREDRNVRNVRNVRKIREGARGRCAILYFHGGGFVAGSSDVYRDLTGRIALAAHVPVLAVNYRLAPEHRYPAANEDCLGAYRWLLGNGYSADNIVLGGDSVGGTLALMTLLSLRDNGEELPAGAFLLSPHADLVHLDGESYDTRAAVDPTGSRARNQAALDAYWGDNAGDYPAILSPLRMDLSGLPELLVQAGDREVLLDDAARLAAKAEASGFRAKLEIWEGMWSVFQTMAFRLPEARRAIENIGSFVRCRLPANSRR
ncbi:alpha/beta hydrolase [Cohnella xylanilytica]|uniref:Alpha/beta hydrolase n=1 Tax=Cohnella xylanilytica TaxID=557555 RepID=A0A841U3D7_9BACL|nr:alpha/beta hydrolase [Cohnella xylanilytica]MBB6692494.1 alpha/beta hydrolase [Cohnella xylanilytica]